MEIVGIVGTVRDFDWEKRAGPSFPFIYRPVQQSQESILGITIAIRSPRPAPEVFALVREKVKEAGEHVGGMEGEDTGDWVLLDLGEVIVHVMQPATRTHYNLEELWGAGEAARARHIQADH